MTLLVPVVSLPVVGSLDATAVVLLVVGVVGGLIGAQFLLSWLKSAVLRLTLHHLASGVAGALLMDVLHSWRPLDGALVGIIDTLAGVVA